MARHPILNLTLATIVMWLMLTVCLHTSQATPDGFSAPPSDLDTIAAVTTSAPVKPIMLPLERYAITTESLWNLNRSSHWIVASGVVIIALLAIGKLLFENWLDMPLLLRLWRTCCSALATF